MIADLLKRWRLVDIGINLTDAMYQGKYQGKRYHTADIADVVRRGSAVGVSGMLITGSNVKESELAIKLCEQFNSDEMQCFCSVGCHPTRCSEFVKDPQAYYDRLDKLITEHSVHHGGCVAAIGEVGLDYDRLFFCPAEIQLQYFERQLDLVEKHKLPLFLHDRNTGGDFHKVITRNRSRLHGGVVHSFTGTQEELQQYLELGFFIGVNGCSLKTEENLKVVRQIPLDRILCETDGPWCDVRNTHASRTLLNSAAGRYETKQCASDTILSRYETCKKEKFREGCLVKGRCEPCHMVTVIEVIHELKKEDGKTLEEVAAVIYENTTKLFPFQSPHDRKTSEA
ncbi:TatD DNase family protein [Angomonas deanei]|nr:TatD DNase family protein [Angomonas deanei]|eukprot:EPY35477.1 TatD DNase family protein [Angomonas deanei]